MTWLTYASLHANLFELFHSLETFSHNPTCMLTTLVFGVNLPFFWIVHKIFKVQLGKQFINCDSKKSSSNDFCWWHGAGTDFTEFLVKVYSIWLGRNVLCDDKKRCHGAITDSTSESAVDCGQEYVIKVICKLRHVPAGCREGGLAFARNIHPATVKSTNTIHHTE